MDVISRGAAKAAGLVWYFTGKPCKQGHLSPRRVSTKHCPECTRKAWRDWAAANPNKERKRHRRARKAMTPEQRERIAQRARARRARNPDFARECWQRDKQDPIKREKHRVRARQWARDHRAAKKDAALRIGRGRKRRPHAKQTARSATSEPLITS